jgi:hypothetical protein
VAPSAKSQGRLFRASVKDGRDMDGEPFKLYKDIFI